MKPVDPGEDYGELRVYGANQPEYEPLVGRVGPTESSGHYLVTKWELSFEERQAVLDGANVWLHVLTFGNPLQPVNLWIEGTEGDPWRPDVSDAEEPV